MSMSVGGSSGEDEVLSTINTTPLVDVMLVLLIIFLITVPVVKENIPVKLPAEINQPTQTKPENIVIAVDTEGSIYWNNKPVADIETLQKRLYEVAVLTPQPEVHIRGDQESRYENVNKVVEACQRASIVKVGFILEPPPKG